MSKNINSFSIYLNQIIFYFFNLINLIYIEFEEKYEDQCPLIISFLYINNLLKLNNK